MVAVTKYFFHSNILSSTTGNWVRNILEGCKIQKCFEFVPCMHMLSFLYKQFSFSSFNLNIYTEDFNRL